MLLQTPIGSHARTDGNAKRDTRTRRGAQLVGHCRGSCIGVNDTRTLCVCVVTMIGARVRKPQI